MKTKMLVAGLAGGVLAIAGMASGWGSPASVPVVAGVASSATAAADAPFTVDGVHSSIVFRVQRTNGAPFYGRFNEISGSFHINGEDPSKSFINVTVPTSSVDSNNKGRDEHLRNADFFSAGEFPELTFKSTGFTKTGEKTYDVAGDLTLRGVTKPITVTVRETGTGPARRGGTMFGADVQFTIKRSDFGVTYGLQALGDEVTLMVGLEGTRQ